MDRNIKMTDVDRPEEVAKVLRKIIDNQNQIEGKLLQIIAAQKIKLPLTDKEKEAKAAKKAADKAAKKAAAAAKKAAAKAAKKGMVSMKTLLAICLVAIMTFCSVAIAEPELLRVGNLGTANGIYRFLVNPSFPGNVAVKGDTTMSGTLSGARKVVTTASALKTVLTVSQSGQVILATATGTSVVSMPSAAAGLIFTIVDSSSTAGNDVRIAPQPLDNINGRSVGTYIANTVDEDGQNLTLIAIDTKRWITTISPTESGWTYE